VAFEKIRKKDLYMNPEVIDTEEKLAESLGTRVHIERKENGGHITIDFFTNDDLRTILDLIKSTENKNPNAMLEDFISKKDALNPVVTEVLVEAPSQINDLEEEMHLVDDRTPDEIEKAEEDIDLYNIKNFSV
jgi:hypothetical protein